MVAASKQESVCPTICLTVIAWDGRLENASALLLMMTVGHEHKIYPNEVRHIEDTY